MPSDTFSSNALREAIDVNPQHVSQSREAITFVSVVNDFDEARHNLLASRVSQSSGHEWLIIDNVGNRRSQHISQLYSEALKHASHDLVFCIHQDVYLPDQWEDDLFRSLNALEQMDPLWGVVGAVGISSAMLLGHWSDPHHILPRRVGPLPAEVFCLDELWLGVRKRRGISFDQNLPGFHCYGIDLSLTAASRGMRSYALDALARHKYRDSDGHRILMPSDSPKLRMRDTPEFMAAAQVCKNYIAEKWKTQLPLRSTSMSWDRPDATTNAPTIDFSARAPLV